MTVSRLLRRIWFIPSKIIVFGMFGIGGIVFTLIVFPLLRLSVWDNGRFRCLLRALVGISFRLFTRFVGVMGLGHVHFENYQRLTHLKSSIVCANHPSIFDVVILMGYVPNADCIINAGLWRNPFVGAIVRSIYIPNSLSVDETVKRCRESLHQGNNLIIFPEGTRTRGNLPGRFHRSAAQISLRTGCSIVPVSIAMNSASGLGKRDCFFKGPSEGYYIYRIDALDPIPAEADAEQINIKARSLTKALKLVIIEKLEEIP